MLWRQKSHVSCALTERHKSQDNYLLGIICQPEDLNNDFQVELFPNPVEDQLNLILPDYSNYNVKIFNLQGQKLIDRFSDNKEVLIDISKFQKGTYFLKINSLTDKKTVTKKIIKQ